MTPTEILNEINKLPMIDRQKLIDSLSHTNTENEESLDLKLQKSLAEDGLLREIKPPRQKHIGDFPAIKIEGEPLSETIIRERR